MGLMMEEGSTGLGCLDTSSGVWSHDRASALMFFDPCLYEMVKLNRVKNKVHLVCLSASLLPEDAEYFCDQCGR